MCKYRKETNEIDTEYCWMSFLSLSISQSEIVTPPLQYVTVVFFWRWSNLPGGCLKFKMRIHLFEFFQKWIFLKNSIFMNVYFKLDVCVVGSLAWSTFWIWSLLLLLLLIKNASSKYECEGVTISDYYFCISEMREAAILRINLIVPSHGVCVHLKP